MELSVSPEHDYSREHCFANLLKRKPSGACVRTQLRPRHGQVQIQDAADGSALVPSGPANLRNPRDERREQRCWFWYVVISKKASTRRNVQSRSGARHINVFKHIGSRRKSKSTSSAMNLELAVRILGDGSQEGRVWQKIMPASMLYTQNVTGEYFVPLGNM